MKKIIASLLIIVGLFGSAFPKNVKRPTYNYNHAVEAFKNGNFEEAFEYLGRELQDNPDNGYALYKIGFIYLDQMNYGRAMEALDLAIKKLPKKDKKSRSLAYAIRAAIYIKLEEPEKALAELKSAIKEAPDDADMYRVRANIYHNMGRYDLSDKDYQKIISIDPWNVIGYMGLGRNAKQRMKYEEAIALFDYVIKIDPEYSSGYSSRAECYIAQKKYSEAMDDIIMALSLVDEDACYLLLAMDKCVLPLITRKLQIQAEKNPNEPDWYFYLGQVHYKNGFFRESIPFYEKSNHLVAHPIVVGAIADSYFALGEYSKALDYINQAICMDETNYEFVIKKGNIYNEMGNYPEAIAELDKYIKENPDDFFGTIAEDG